MLAQQDPKAKIQSENERHEEISPHRRFFTIFNPATVSSHYTTLTFEYTHTETEGTRGGVWRIRRRSNTAPKDVLLVYIVEREEEEGGGRGLISGIAIDIASLLYAHITSIEKGLGSLLLDLSRRFLTHVELPKTN